MVFALAGTDPGKLDAVLLTPVEDVCMLYLEWLKSLAERGYDRALMVWSNQSAFSKAKPPEIPKILRDLG